MDDAPRQLAPEQVAEPTHRRVVLDDEELAERLDELSQPLRVDPVQPGHVYDLQHDTLGDETLRSAQRLVQHHRAVGEEESVGALEEDGSAPGSRVIAGRQLDPARRGTDGQTQSDVLARVLDGPAQ